MEQVTAAIVVTVIILGLLIAMIWVIVIEKRKAISQNVHCCHDFERKQGGCETVCVRCKQSGPKRHEFVWKQGNCQAVCVRCNEPGGWQHQFTDWSNGRRTCLICGRAEINESMCQKCGASLEQYEKLTDSGRYRKDLNCPNCDGTFCEKCGRKTLNKFARNDYLDDWGNYCAVCGRWKGT